MPLNQGHAHLGGKALGNLNKIKAKGSAQHVNQRVGEDGTPQAIAKRVVLLQLVFASSPSLPLIGHNSSRNPGIWAAGLA